MALGEELESTTPTEAKVLRTYLSPATGEVPEFWAGDSSVGAEAEDEAVTDENMYADPGFDLVAAALSDMSDSVPTAPSESKSDSGDMGQDAISALFAANDPDPEAPAAEPVDLNGDMGQDAISALFAANDAEPETFTEPEAAVSGDMGQDAIAALFAANDPEPEVVAEPETFAEPEAPISGDMGQDAIAALFAANDSEPEAAAEPEDTSSGYMGQDAISALFGNEETAPDLTPDAPATSDDIEIKTYDSVEDDLVNTDLPEVNMVQLNPDEEVPELSNFDDFDAEDDIDSDLIDSILEGKNEDPAA